jgi:NADPH:quinone reductase-like Zn-dependent oxidoreductase
MKSIFLKKYGKASEAFEIRDAERPKCGAEDVLIEVECFGLNYAEVMARHGLYKPAPKPPGVLGYEVVGTIREVGKSGDSSLIGKRVVAFTRFGGYAETVVTNKNAFAEIGDMDAGEACCIAVQYATAYYMAVETTNIQQGDRVLIHAGAGGVGTALIQLCKLKGAFVFANAGRDDKLQYMKDQGADEVMNSRKDDYELVVKSKLGKDKLDITFNPIAGSTFKKDFRLLGSGGRLILFGASERAGKKFGFFSTVNFLRKMGIMLPIFLVGSSKSIIGVNMLNIGDDKPEVLARCMKNVAELVKSGTLKPHVGARFKASEIAQAHDLLESRKSMGKIVVHW